MKHDAIIYKIKESCSDRKEWESTKQELSNIWIVFKWKEKCK